VRFLTACLERLYAAMLWLYPRQFQATFSAEMQDVFRQVSRQAADNYGNLFIIFLRELRELPLAALREHWQARKESRFMDRLTNPTEKPTPRWVIVAILCLFLIPRILGSVLSVELPDWVVVTFLIFFVGLAFLLPLGLGLARRLPRWSLLYIGIITGVIGMFVFFTSIEAAFEAQILRAMRQVLAGGDLGSRITWQWMNQARHWFGILLANLLFLGILALLPWFRAQLRRFWQDLTLLSFLFYGGILIIFMIDFDEYRYDELYQLACMASLAAGAWAYLRAATPGRRTLALLAGLTACMAIMGIGKYILVPQQDWPVWFSHYPPESERWFESLRTIATWFWAALMVGLPGVLQTLRKEPAVEPLESLQAI
jgi:hypothetical protein